MSHSEPVVQKTDGMPLFVIELLQELTRDNLLTHIFTRGWEWDKDFIDKLWKIFGVLTKEIKAWTYQSGIRFNDDASVYALYVLQLFMLPVTTSFAIFRQRMSRGHHFPHACAKDCHQKEQYACFNTVLTNWETWAVILNALIYISIISWEKKCKCCPHTSTIYYFMMVLSIFTSWDKLAIYSI